MTDRRIRILVVDDEITSRLLLKAALERFQFEVVLAEDGLSALQAIEQQAIDLVMLDFEMPGLNGHEVCTRIRGRRGKDLPIVMVTGSHDVESVQRAFEVGASDFIAKPINWALVGQRVRFLLRAHDNVRELRAAHARTAGLLAAIPDTLYRVEANGNVYDASLLAESHQVAFEPCCRLSDAFPPDVADRVLESAGRSRNSGSAEGFEYAVTDGDLTPSHREMRVVAVGPDEFLMLIRDITERKRQEHALVEAKNDLRDTLRAIPDTILELDLDGLCLEYHTQEGGQLSAPPREWLGRHVVEVLPPPAAAVCLAALHEANERGLCTGRQFDLTLPEGRRWFELSIARKSSDAGAQSRFIALSRDVTERKEAENNVYRLAYFDTLTQLPNRLSFSERLDRETRRANPKEEKLAVLFLDLDGFKNVNDSMGHGAGDLLLQMVADRLKSSVRPADMVARGETAEADGNIELARLGGDEFTLLVPNLRRTEDVLRVTHRIHEAIRRPFVLDERNVVVSASIGIAVFPDDGADAPTLLKHADTAMYHAKERGRDNFQFYSASLTEEVSRRMNLESGLRRALDRGELFLVYQPQLDLRTERIKAMEALIRWNHPEHGAVPPSEFIPIAEETGQIIAIGAWVLRQACADAAAWAAAGKPMRVAVNLSAVQFRQPGLIDLVKATLRDNRLEPNLLELEITEGVLMEDTAATATTLASLRAIGVRLALDDFGTGYSSLSYLKRLPLDTLKVDRSFIAGLPSDGDSLAIVSAILSLSKNLGFMVTAEGIETVEQARILRRLGAEMLQGYLVGKPLPYDVNSEMTAQAVLETVDWTPQDGAPIGFGAVWQPGSHQQATAPGHPSV